MTIVSMLESPPAVTGTVIIENHSWLTWEVDAKLLRVWLHTQESEIPRLVATLPTDALRAALDAG